MQPEASTLSAPPYYVFSRSWSRVQYTIYEHALCEARITEHEDDYNNVTWPPYIIDYNSTAIVVIFLILSFLYLSLSPLYVTTIILA